MVSSDELPFRVGSLLLDKTHKDAYARCIVFKFVGNIAEVWWDCDILRSKVISNYLLISWIDSGRVEVEVF